MKKIILSLAGLLMMTLGYSQLDTTGVYQWTKMYNSMYSWDEGAFNMFSLGHPDYGWGIYNMQTHDVDGDSLYVIKLQDGSWKYLYLQLKQSVQNIYTLRYSDMDEQNEVIEYIDNSPYTDKLFTYYSLENNAFVDREPAKDNWDLVLTKYHDNLIDYNVTGLLINENCSASVYSAADSVAAYNAALSDTTEFSDSITIIGNSWYELQGMSIVPLADMAYFIKTNEGEIYRMNVSYFESGYSGQGRVGVRTQKLAPEEGEPVNDTLTMGMMYANDVFYKLSDGNKHTAPRDNWDIAFKTAQFSASVLANTTMGVELYTYPNADETAWMTYGIENKEVKNLSVYPNPVRQVLNLVTDPQYSGEKTNIRIIDLTGRELVNMNTESAGEIRIDVGNLPSGIYLLYMNSDSFRGAGRFIKAE